jgi:autoinducer-2 kinase
LLAIDAGTGSCRAVVFDDLGSQLAVAQREWTHLEVPGVRGSQVFDAEANWRLISSCIAEVVSGAVRAGDIRAVTATSMREGMVLYDRAGREIWACPNVDSRAVDEAEELVRSGAAQTIFERAGDWVSITAPARFRWIARHQPDVFDAIAHVGMLGDWIVTRLCGAFVTDPSLGSSSGMFDLASRRWSDEILSLCGLDATPFPEVVESGTVVGAVTSAAALQTGLVEGTPVVVGGADTQLGLVGIGITEPGRMTIVGGSFWQTTVLTDRPAIDPGGRLRTLCHTEAGLWMTEGIGFYSGLVARWFRDAFCRDDVETAAREGRDVYELLESEAAKAPAGANGVVGIFSNLMDARHWVHAAPAFVGFDVSSPATSGKKECFRAIEEAAAYVAEGHRRIIEELTDTEIDEVVLTGGAAKGNLWSQIVADVLGVPVHIPVVKESTSLGAALYAGIGAGLYGAVDDVVGEVVRFERVVAPDIVRHATYRDLYLRWLELYEASLRLSETTGVSPLWRAGGT